MDQFAQTNDLQQAIETVANGGSAVDNNAAQFGIPPMPPMPENGNELPKVEPLAPANEHTPSAEEILSQSITSGNMPPAIEPVPVSEPTAKAMPEAVSSVAPAEPSAMEPGNVEPSVEPVANENIQTPVEEAAPAEDLSDVKQSILKDLLPLLDKTEKTPEEKFEIYKDAIATMHDVKTIEGAYKAASAIGDEVKRADALFDVMRVIDAQ